ncbi:MAG: Holliday junction resolvase RuvX [Anaerolineae bacterium]|nr:Holliday junction resolvase RuvX [Anaerolineae bacterium]
MKERAGRLLALDVGERRVGVAVSDVAGWLARPLTIITRRSRREDFAAIARLVEEQEATAVVVGYPLNMDDSIGPQARRVARYAAALQRVLPVPVVLWDERLSSEEALQRLRAAGGSRRRRSHLDDAAAAVILQEYLDAQRQAHRQENA